MCHSYVHGISDFKPIAVSSPEEFSTYKVTVGRTAAFCRFESQSASKLHEIFPKSKLLSEVRRQNPLAFARSRVDMAGRFVQYPEGIGVQDTNSTVFFYETGTLTLDSAYRVEAAINVIHGYAAKLKEHDLYSKDSFAVGIGSINGKAKIPVGFLGSIDLRKAADFLVEAVFDRAKAEFLVYNMKAMDVQILLRSNGEVHYTTTEQESNIARALKLLDESLKLKRDVSVEVVREKPKEKAFTYCVSCGAKLPLDSKFCEECGAELRN